VATYRIKLIARHPTREIVTKIAGCRDEAHCEEKARGYYDVHEVRWMELVEGGQAELPEEPKEKPVAGGIDL
jgi:hypothetical protein